MSELNSEQKKYYIDIAEKHADFLIEKLFRPTFLMAFIHGVKHGRKDAIEELLDSNEKVKMKDGILWFGDELDNQSRTKRKK